MPDISRRHLLRLLGGSAAIGMPVSISAASPSAAETSGDRVYRNDREDGRFVSTAGFIQEALQHLRPRLAFDPAMPAEAFPAWRKLARNKLRELLVFPEVPPQPEPKRLWSKPREGYQLQKWEFYPEPYCAVPFLMLVPDGASQQSPTPAAVCLPGTFSTKESLAGELELDGTPTKHRHRLSNRMALHFVKQGITSVALDNPGIGETKDRVNKGRMYDFAIHAIWMGRNYEGISTFHRWSILQWLKQQPWVDSSRLVVSGHSLGAKPALHVGLLDPSVKAVIWNDAVVSWRHRAVVTAMQQIGIFQHIPGLLQWLDYPDLMAALAPRSFLICEGGRGEEIDRIRAAYRLAGAEDRLKVAYYPKYASPESRKLDDTEIPEGLTLDQHHPYANVDAPDHQFRVGVALPWLKRVLDD